MAAGGGKAVKYKICTITHQISTQQYAILREKKHVGIDGNLERKINTHESMRDFLSRLNCYLFVLSVDFYVFFFLFIYISIKYFQTTFEKLLLALS